MKRSRLGIILAVAMGAAAAVSTQELSLRGDISGNWFDPARDGQGLQIEVIDARRAVVAWYTFDAAGNPAWLFGVGEISSDTIVVELEQFSGGAFPATPGGAPARGEPWGTATLVFDSCSEAAMSWTTDAQGFADGNMPLARLTAIRELRCGQAEEFEHVVTFSLDAGPGQWEALFADYDEAQQDIILPEAGRERLPEPLDDRHGFMLAGTNRSDDLAMFLVHPVGGLTADTAYRVELEMTFATEVPQGCAGAGGSPGESVYVKLGASGVKPVVVNADGFFELNIDKGIQSQEGRDALVAGDMTNFQEECLPSEQWEWQIKTVATRGRDFFATTDADGRLWVYGGSDSAFESRTTYFVTEFTVRLAPGAEQ